MLHTLYSYDCPMKYVVCLLPLYQEDTSLYHVTPSRLTVYTRKNCHVKPRNSMTPYMNLDTLLMLLHTDTHTRTHTWAGLWMSHFYKYILYLDCIQLYFLFYSFVEKLILRSDFSVLSGLFWNISIDQPGWNPEISLSLKCSD